MNVRAGAFRGATAWEWYVGRLWGRILLPSFWRCCFPWLIEFGWDRTDYEECHVNGKPKWATDGVLLDDKGNRSIFDDIDE